MSMSGFGDITFKARIEESWLDHNHHMNLGYFLIVFDHGTGGLYRRLGIGETRRIEIGETLFTLEARVIYLKELCLDDEFRIETRILGYDHNKIYYMHWMIDEKNGEVCAINELMGINVDITSRKSAPFNDETLSKLAALSREHEVYPIPEEAGGAMRQLGFPGLTESIA